MMLTYDDEKAFSLKYVPVIRFYHGTELFTLLVDTNGHASTLPPNRTIAGLK